jgi:hypothetical protein
MIDARLSRKVSSVRRVSMATLESLITGLGRNPRDFPRCGDRMDLPHVARDRP